MTEGNIKEQEVLDKSLSESKLVPNPGIKDTTYGKALLTGLDYIESTLEVSKHVNRFVTFPIPYDLAMTQGTPDNHFLSAMGNLSRLPSIGLRVGVSKGLSYKNTKTGIEENTVVIDIEHTSNFDRDALCEFLNKNDIQ